MNTQIRKIFRTALFGAIIAWYDGEFEIYVMCLKAIEEIFTQEHVVSNLQMQYKIIQKEIDEWEKFNDPYHPF